MLSLHDIEYLRVNNDPSSGVEVISGSTLDLTVEFELEVSRRKHVHGGWCSILDNEGRLLGLGDDS